jgi:inner membrane protein
MPAGYICSKWLYPRFVSVPVDYRKYLLCGLIGSIAPDLDLLYFYLVDHRQHHHHSYWTHYPVVWLGLTVAAFLYYRYGRQRIKAVLLLVLSFNGFMHMVLDTLVGDISWFAPVSDRAYSLIMVPARFDPWWLNFVLHWSLLVEVVIMATALGIWRKGASGQRWLKNAL